MTTRAFNSGENTSTLKLETSNNPFSESSTPRRRPSTIMRTLSTSSASNSPPMIMPNKASHVCQECGRAFSRAEHLERHLTTHMSATASKTFICCTCSKGFTRKDVLTRHIRAVHETLKTEIKKSRRRSCQRCASFKIKCSGGAEKDQPQKVACKACVKRGVDCIFDVDSSLANDGENNPYIKGVQEDNEDLNSEANVRGCDLEYKDHASMPGAGERPYKRRKTISVVEKQDKHAPSYEHYSDQNSNMSQQLLSATMFLSNETQTKTDNEHSFNSSGLAYANNMPIPFADGPLSILSRSLQSKDERGKVKRGKSHSVPSLSYSYQSASVPSSSKEGQFVSSFQPTLESHLDASGNTVLPLDPSLLQLLTPTQLSSNIFASPRARNNDTHIQDNHTNLNSQDLGSLANEDYYAATTLHGILPLNPQGLSQDGNRSTLHSYDNFGQQQNIPESWVKHNLGLLSDMNRSIQSSGTLPNDKLLGDKYGFPMDDASTENWFLDPGVFEFDWLRGDIVDLTLPIKDTQNDNQFSSLMPSSINASKLDASTSDDISPMPSTALYNSQLDLQYNSNNQSKSHMRSTGISNVPPTADNSSGKQPDDDALRLPLVSPPIGKEQNEDAWPWNWQLSSEKQQKINLPPLRQVLEDCTPQSGASRKDYEHLTSHVADILPNCPTIVSSSSNPHVTDKIRQDMISLLTVPFKKQPYTHLDISMEKFPSNELFNDFIKLYFENFHGVLPMIHVPTFRPEACPSILLTAIATIGARYHHAEGAKEFADSLSELSHRAMTWMVIMISACSK